MRQFILFVFGIFALGMFALPSATQEAQVESFGYAETTTMSFLTEEDSWAYTHARFRPTFEATLNDRLILSSSFSITGKASHLPRFFWTDCAPSQTCFSLTVWARKCPL